MYQRNIGEMVSKIASMQRDIRNACRTDDLSLCYDPLCNRILGCRDRYSANLSYSWYYGIHGSYNQWKEYRLRK